MFLDVLQTNKHRSEAGSRGVAILKTLSWRIIGTLDTVLISYLLTGNLKIAAGIGSIEVVSKMILYYMHERVWTRITKNNFHEN